jgi:NAD(P)-dependent dehydrogenase (short-subunit alcohol dehydrogenase family)
VAVVSALFGAANRPGGPESPRVPPAGNARGRGSDGATGGRSNRQRVSVNACFQPDGLVIDYGAAKAALLNVAKALSQELGPNGIRINSVLPGQVETDLWLGDHGVAATIGAATGVDPARMRDQAHAAIATGRFSTAEEVATLVALLASPRTASVTADQEGELMLRGSNR